jgi:SnoaL-like domain
MRYEIKLKNLANTAFGVPHFCEKGYMSNTTGNMSAPAQYEMPTVLQRMSDAINAHDVDALVSCFANDYKGELPLHPESAFTGLAQVRENWTAL